jgi:hypothetical protein
MANASEFSEIVSDFFFKTCAINSRSKSTNDAILHMSATCMDIPIYFIGTGSASELYIEPMLNCIRDVDFMIPLMESLAVPSRREIPRHLPPTFDNSVDVYEIVEAELPGYVYLPKVGHLTKRLNGISMNSKCCHTQVSPSNM